MYGFDALHDAVGGVGCGKGAHNRLCPLALGDGDRVTILHADGAVGISVALLARYSGGLHAVFRRHAVGGGLVGSIRSRGEPLQQHPAVCLFGCKQRALRSRHHGLEQAVLDDLRNLRIAHGFFMHLTLGGFGGDNVATIGIKNEAQPRGIREHEAGGLTRGARRAISILQLHAEIALAGFPLRAGQGGVRFIHRKSKRHALGGGNGDGACITGAGPAPRAIILEGRCTLCREHGEHLSAADVIVGGGYIRRGLGIRIAIKIATATAGGADGGIRLIQHRGICTEGVNGIAEELAVLVHIRHVIVRQAGTDVVRACGEREQAQFVGAHLRQPQEGIVNMFPLIALQMLVEVQRIGSGGINLRLHGCIAGRLIRRHQRITGNEQISLIIHLQVDHHGRILLHHQLRVKRQHLIHTMRARLSIHQRLLYQRCTACGCNV